MDLTLSRNDCLNTLVSTNDGRHLYHVDTPSKAFGTANTKITKIQHGTEVEISTVEWHSWSRDQVLWVNNRKLVMNKCGTMSSSWSFEGSDGEYYKWKINGNSSWLVIDDRSHVYTTVVTLKRAKRGRPAVLKVESIGVQILDEIVTSFIWYEQKRRRSSFSAGRVLQRVSDTFDG